VTEKELPAIVALANRSCVVEFCVHETVTVPEPLPFGGVALSQDPFPEAVQLPPEQLAGDTPVTVTT
jgi:hypothetical protein